MIIQLEETVNATQSPHSTLDTQCLTNSSTTEVLLQSGQDVPKDSLRDRSTTIFLAPQPIEFCRQLSPITELPEFPRLFSDSSQQSTSKTYFLPEFSTSAQDLQNVTLHAHMRENA